MSLRVLRGAILIVAAAAGTQVTAQTLYKCTQANGRVVYQQEPCSDASRQSTVRPPDPKASKTDAELKAEGDKAAKAAATEMSGIGTTMADVSLCVSDLPGFDEKYGAAIQQWKNRNGPAVARFDQDQDARAKAIARMESERSRLKAPGALAANCERVAGSIGAAPASAPRK